jgi:signal transduction histidine kinase
LLSVRDDGAGFDAATPPASGHFGLLGMKERARRIGAELLVESSPGHGTEVKLILPRGKSTS